MKVIAETASNHMGELDYLKEISLQCCKSGADIITVQIFNLEAFVTPKDSLSYSNFLKTHIEQKDWSDYFKWSKEHNIDVLPCILDVPSAELCKEHEFKSVKIHASDIVNLEFLELIDDYFETVFLEFGGANLDEIKTALSCFINTEVILLYGFNAYPTLIENQNLNFLQTLEYLFDCKTGFADHSVGNEFIPLLAMAKGALYLEKHVTLDSKNEDRFDWQVSVEPDELKKMVDQIRDYKPAFGEPLRLVSEGEKHFRKLVYKKLVLNKDKKEKEKILEGDLEIKRSIEGIESTQIGTLLNKVLNKDLSKGTPIAYSDII